MQCCHPLAGKLLGLYPVVYLDSGLVGQTAEEQKMLTLLIFHTARGFSYRTDYYL